MGSIVPDLPLKERRICRKIYRNLFVIQEKGFDIIRTCGEVRLRHLPKNVQKTLRYIRQDATLDQLDDIEKNVLRMIHVRRRRLLAESSKSTSNNREVGVTPSGI
ncbi:hypothetical protein GCM10025859_00820 [Alicyclobacillus fastidiosus]|nr:hypothetical protein GCM10025859_00820 [Alicyclobacillus fastidiosus]